MATYTNYKMKKKTTQEESDNIVMAVDESQTIEIYSESL